MARSTILLALCLASLSCASAYLNDGNAFSSNAVIAIIQAAYEDSSKCGVLVSAMTDSCFFPNSATLGFQSTTCPNLKAGLGACTADACKAGGILGKFSLTKPYDAGTPVKNARVLYSGFSNPTTVITADAASCCSLCAKTPKCAWWQFVPTSVDTKSCSPLKTSGGACSLEDHEMTLTCGQQQVTWQSGGTSNVDVKSGGYCNDDPSITNDPHLTGAQGTRFDFNGAPNKAFCLLSDERLQVNMQLRGYYDTRTEGASVLSDGKAVRTWIRQLGVLFMEGRTKHTVLLGARDGKSQERGQGFLSTMKVDGIDVPRLAVGGVFNGPAGLAITFVGYEKAGAFDVDFYTVEIPGLATLEVRLRIAHPLLQTPEDAETHINVNFANLEATSRIHGVLGQTYRDDHSQRAVDFQKIVSELHRPIAADTEEGQGFLDGKPDDYLVSSVLAPDCAYTVFDQAVSADDNAVIGM